MPLKNFCNPEHEAETWYAVAEGRKIPPGRSQRIAIGKHLLLVRRFRNGQLAATDRFCPHMGADLSYATELPNHAIQCAFHGLTFGKEGTCATRTLAGTMPKLRMYPIEERYGLIWVYLGERPTFQIPDLELDGGWAFHYPSQKLRAHHHIVICNGLDFTHTRLVHTFEMLEHRLERLAPEILRAHIRGGYRLWWMKFLSWTGSYPLTFTFTAYGPSISVADTDWHGTRLVILFTAHQNPDGTSSTHTLLWIGSRNPINWFRGWAVVTGILWQDAHILNTIRVRENFTPNDEGMIAYRDMVDALPAHTIQPETELGSKNWSPA